MAITKNFLAQQLTNPTAIQGRTTPVFQDSRVKTSVPYPYIETILPGISGCSGIIGTYEKNMFVPEVGAYIYVYINGFLINPPSLGSKGDYQNTNTAIISDQNGNWKIDSLFFDVLPVFAYGQTITFRAKAPLKQMSDRSVPYAIGSTPTPIDVGIIGDFGIVRPPYVGEYSLMGRMSYWLNSISGQGEPNFDCNNHIYVYVNGVHAGTYGNILGEIFKNEIRGVGVTYPISTSLNNKSLFLTVDDQPLEVPIKNLTPVDSSPLFQVSSGPSPTATGEGTSITTFWFPLPDETIYPKIYRNGIRQAEGIDYTYDLDLPSKKGTISFTYVPEDGDDLIVVFQYYSSEIITGEVPGGIIDGSNQYFTFKQTPLISSVELYLNGLHLVGQGNIGNNQTTYDYSIVFDPPNNRQLIKFVIPPTVDSVILVDYQPTDSNLPPTEILDFAPIHVTNQYSYSVLNTAVGKPNIYKNGVRLKEGPWFSNETGQTTGNTLLPSNDYSLKDPNLVCFTPWSAPTDKDNVLIVFYAIPFILQTIIDYLNSTPEFAENCLTATSLGRITLSTNITPVGIKNRDNKNFDLPTDYVHLPVNYKVFKNGLRQKEHLGKNSTGDYTIDYKNNQFIFDIPPAPDDSLSVILNYITTTYKVGESPTKLSSGLYSLALLPQANTVAVYLNGMRLIINSDYIVQGKNIRFQSYTPIDQDTIIVDYEPAYTPYTYTSSLLFAAVATGTYTFVPPTKGTAINVFVNGILQQPFSDYTISTGSITFEDTSNFTGEGSSVGKTGIEPGDLILVEFISANLFSTSSVDQLKIVSPYKLDIKRYPGGKLDFVQQTLFGNEVNLYPGRDTDGEFYFWFSRRTGYWKWSWINPDTNEITLFQEGQRITVRAWNESLFTYGIPD